MISPPFQTYGRVARSGQPELIEVDSGPLGRSYLVGVSCPAEGYFVTIFDDITERIELEPGLAAERLGPGGLFGAIALTFLGVREFPAIDPPVVTVSTGYTGANADVIENQITEPLEESINGIAGDLLFQCPCGFPCGCWWTRAGSAWRR